MSNPKMADVARYADVSVSTVSHVINHTRVVGEDTKQRVLDAIRELNYSPDFVARSFKTGKKHLIGFVVPDISNSFFSTLIDNVQNVLSDNGYGLIVVNTNEDQDKEFNSLQFLSSGIIDALIIATTCEDFSTLSTKLPERMPILFVDRLLNGNIYDSITISAEVAIDDGVEYLISKGKKKIGYIAGLKRLSTTTERLKAFGNSLDKHGICFDKQYERGLVRYANSMVNSATGLVDDLIASGCDSILVSNNVMTFDVINRLKVLNIEIPVIGFCDSPLDERFLGNTAKIVQPSAEVGKAVAEQLLLRLDFPKMPVKNQILYSVFKPLNG